MVDDRLEGSGLEDELEVGDADVQKEKDDEVSSVVVDEVVEDELEVGGATEDEVVGSETTAQFP